MKTQTIIRTERTPTIADVPLAIGTILARNEQRQKRTSIFSRLTRVSPARVVHKARLSEGLVESNLPT